MEIIVDHVSKTIKKICVLNNVSLRMSGGRIYGLQGANGSGKTMLLRLISGLIRPTSGKIYIDGYQLGENMDFPDSMGLLIENPAFLSGYTGFENLKLLANIQMKISENDIRDALCKVGLDPNDSRKYRKFSLGMKQRLGIAAAIMENPSLILLDEPFNALDEEGIEQIKQIIVMYRDKGALIVLACHDTNMLENISDKIYHISNGIIQA